MDLLIYLNALTALFVIIDPIGVALIFHTLIRSDSYRVRAATAIKAGLISVVLLVLFGNYGESLLGQLGISIHALRISGGLLLFYTAFNMITNEVSFDPSDNAKDISVFPLSIPLQAGPGSLTVCILLFSNAGTAMHQLTIAAAVVSVCGLSVVLMVLAKNVKKIIGRIGDEILRRFLGVLLAALAIQFIMDGVAGVS